MKPRDKFFTLISLPGILYLLSLVLFPLVVTIYLSFHKYNFIENNFNKINWIGLKNYVNIFTDINFWNSIMNTGIYLVLGVLFELFIGLIIALLIFNLFKNRSIVTSLILLPSMIAPIVVGFIFRFTFNPQFGIFDYVLKMMGFIKGSSILGNKATALLGIIVADIWQWAPFVAIIIFSGLITLPSDPYEAARIDGANDFVILTKITLPLLKPVIAIVILIRIADIIREFDKIFVMTYGGPGRASEVLNFTAYKINYINFDMGIGSAHVVIIFAIVILLSLAVFKTFYTQEI